MGGAVWVVGRARTLTLLATLPAQAESNKRELQNSYEELAAMMRSLQEDLTGKDAAMNQERSSLAQRVLEERKRCGACQQGVPYEEWARWL